MKQKKYIGSMAAIPGPINGIVMVEANLWVQCVD